MVLPVFKRSQDLDAKLAYGIQFFWRKFEIFKTLECGRDLKIRSQNCDLRNPPNVNLRNLIQMSFFQIGTNFGKIQRI